MSLLLLCMLVILFALKLVFNRASRGNVDFHKGFWVGVVMMASSLSITQDIFGKEAYIQEIASAWVSPWVTLPLILLLITFWIYDIWCYYKEKKESK
jgi:hypothetical protein